MAGLRIQMICPPDHFEGANTFADIMGNNGDAFGNTMLSNGYGFCSVIADGQFLAFADSYFPEGTYNGEADLSEYHESVRLALESSEIGRFEKDRDFISSKGLSVVNE